MAATLMVAPQVFAYDGYISTAGKSTVVFVVGNFASATGFGAHFSTSSYTDGLGGYDAECHFIEGGNHVSLYCYDGYQDANNHHNEFFLPLGDKARLSSVTITVRANEVRVEAIRIATNPYTTERKSFTVTGLFPVRESSGFFRSSPIYYQTNTVLAGPYTGRTGSGYQILAAYSY